MGRKVGAFRDPDANTITAADLKWWPPLRIGKRSTGRVIPRRAPDVTSVERDNRQPTQTVASPMPDAGTPRRRFSDQVTAAPAARSLTSLRSSTHP